MDGNGHTRVDLGGGQWADIRPVTIGDLRFQRKRAHERGYEDEVEDGLAIIPRLVRAWSFGEVTDDVLDSLDTKVATALLTAVSGSSDPNVSAPSSAGEGNQLKTEA